MVISCNEGESIISNPLNVDGAPTCEVNTCSDATVLKTVIHIILFMFYIKIIGCYIIVEIINIIYVLC